MVENDAARRAQLFFLNDTASDATSSNSEEGDSHAHYLLQHEKYLKARKEVQQKAMMVAAQAEAANLIGPNASLSQATQEQQPGGSTQDTQSLLISPEEILSQMDPSLLSHLQGKNGQIVLPQKEQLHKRLQSVQTFVKNYCIDPSNKESRNALTNAQNEEQRTIAEKKARQVLQLNKDFEEAFTLGQMLAPTALKSQQPVNESPQQQQEDQGGQESGQNQCECGAQAKFFQLQSGRHVCEQCILQEIYAEESYEDVYLKVLNKMQNIMRLRMKTLQNYKNDWKNKQAPPNHHQPTGASTTQEQMTDMQSAAGVEESKHQEQVSNRQSAKNKTEQIAEQDGKHKMSADSSKDSQTVSAAKAEQPKRLWFQKSRDEIGSSVKQVAKGGEAVAEETKSEQPQKSELARTPVAGFQLSQKAQNTGATKASGQGKARKQALDPQSIQQEQAMTQQANLMYDLLHIEIEKIRRKSIAQIQQKFIKQAAQQQQAKK